MMSNEKVIEGELDPGSLRTSKDCRLIIFYPTEVKEVSLQVTQSDHPS